MRGRRPGRKTGAACRVKGAGGDPVRRKWVGALRFAHALGGKEVIYRVGGSRTTMAPTR